MKALLRKWVLVAGGLLLLGGVVLGILSAVAASFVSEERLVRMAEEEINSRVWMGEARLSLFRLPAVITLREVALGPRDGEVGKPLDERAALVDPPVRLNEVRLAVSLPELLKRRLVIKEFVFEEPHLAVTLYEDGDNSLDELLRAPGEVKRPRPLQDEEEGQGEDGPAREGEDDETFNTRSLNIYAHGFLARLHEVRMDRGRLALTIEKTGMVVTVRELGARLDQLDLDPAAIEKTNTARVHLTGRVEIDATDDDLRYAQLDLDGVAAATLFDPRTGDLDPELMGEFAFGESSYLNARVPVIQKAWKALQKLESIGLEIGELPEKATFGRGGRVSVHYADERFTLRAPFSIWFKDWEVAALEGTWIQTESEQHRAGAEIIAEQELSDELREEIGKGVDFLPGELRPILVEEVEAAWFREGRLVAVLASEGELTSPEVGLRNALPDLQALIRRASEEFLGRDAGELLRNLLGGQRD